VAASSPNLATVFYAKTWYFYVGATVITLLALFSSIMGPLFLFEIMKRADGQPGTDAGVALSIMALPLWLVALLGWFNVSARQGPLLRLCREGLEVNVIGASSLDGVPLVPAVMRVAWLILTLQGFKKQIGWIPWELLRRVSVAGPPMMRTLAIDATVIYPRSRGDALTAQLGNGIGFRDAEFQVGLDTIASSILAFSGDPEARGVLPSLYD